MKVETIKQFNLITYLHWQFLFLAWSNFYIRNHVYLQPFRNLERLNQFHYQVLMGNEYKSMKAWIHEFMNSWIHESMISCLCTAIIKVHENQVTLYEACFHAFVLQLSRYMKIRWHYIYEVYFHTYTFIKCFQISPPDSNVLENGINIEHSALWQWNSSWIC